MEVKVWWPMRREKINDLTDCKTLAVLPKILYVPLGTIISERVMFVRYKDWPRVPLAFALNINAAIEN